MKTHHYIFLSTIAFIVLFYNEDVGLNLGILGVLYSVLTLIKTPERNRSKTFFLLFAAGISSSIAFAWFADFSSFLALVVSLLLLSFRSRNRRMKSLFLVPVFVINFFTFICRVFSFGDWLPKKKHSESVSENICFRHCSFNFCIGIFRYLCRSERPFCRSF